MEIVGPTRKRQVTWDVCGCNYKRYRCYTSANCMSNCRIKLLAVQNVHM